MTRVALRRWFERPVGGSWGIDPGEGDEEALCVRGTDLEFDHLDVDLEAAPLRGFTKEDVRRRSLRAGDIVIEKSGGGDTQPVGRVGLFRGSILAIPTNFAARLRPRRSIEPRFACYTLASLYFAGRTMAAVKQTTGIQNLDLDALLANRAWLPQLAEQRAIVDYLDAETARIDTLIAKKQQLIHVLHERIDAEIMEVVGRSDIVGPDGEASVEIRHVLNKLDRQPVVDEMITAFRDGQVTTRAARGKDGFTNSWTDNARVQGVEAGDVVVHGLDGFSGAIGDSEADGVCSPVYHVCRPRGGGDPAFYGRLLRRLALTGYLGNFAVSTRERAVDFRNWDLFGRIPIPHAPIEQQREIGDRIRKLRPLVQLVERSEALALERKSALISRVVVGELTVAG